MCTRNLKRYQGCYHVVISEGDCGRCNCTCDDFEILTTNASGKCDQCVRISRIRNQRAEGVLRDVLEPVYEKSTRPYRELRAAHRGSNLRARKGHIYTLERLDVVNLPRVLTSTAWLDQQHNLAYMHIIAANLASLVWRRIHLIDEEVWRAMSWLDQRRYE